jgi:hypothetical protein
VQKIYKCNRLLDILEEGREKARKIPMGAYMQVVLNANAGVFMEKGIEKGRAKIAGNALAKGLSLDTIGEITGLDIETIKSFVNQ